MQKHSSGWIQYMFGSKSIEWCLTKDFKKCNKDMFLWPSECSSWLWLCCERWGNNAERCHKWRKETLERNPAKERKKENCFQQSFDCLLNDRKRAVYCHLGMKLAWCMLDKSRRRGGIGRGTNKTTSAQILGTTEGGFCLSRKWLWHSEGEGYYPARSTGLQRSLPDWEKLGPKKSYLARCCSSARAVI